MHRYNKQFKKNHKSFNHQRNDLDDHPNPNTKFYSIGSKFLNKNLHFRFSTNNHTQPKKCKFVIMSSLHAHAFSAKFRVILVYYLIISCIKQRRNFLFYHKQHIILSSSINWINKQNDRYIVNYVDNFAWRR